MSKRKLTISLLVFFLYVAVAWVISSLLATGALLVLVGLILTTCGATVLGVYILVSRLKSAAATATQTLPASRPVDSDKSFTKSVQKLIYDANQSLLRSSKIKDKQTKSPIHRLPLYLVSGPGASGKTTTISSSGIGVEKLSGQLDTDSNVSRTELGNFWFAEGSILAEASSGVFADDVKWRTWLRNLSHNQSTPFLNKLPDVSANANNLRGLVLFCEAGDLLGVPDAARQYALSRSLQERMSTVGEVFLSSFPVYVIFSRADRITFFPQYFGRLIGDEDQQVFGCTLPRTPEQAIDPGVYAETQRKEVSEAFNSLYLSLADKRLVYLARETDPSRKSGIYEFPREVKRIRSSLVQILVDAFQPNALKPGPVLRGFYFTGVRQVSSVIHASDFPHVGGAGAAFDGGLTRLFKAGDLQSIAAASGQKPTSPERLMPKWAFVTQAFRDIILADRHVAPASQGNYSRTFDGTLIRVALAATCAAWLLLVSWSFFNNHSLLESVESASTFPPLAANSQLSEETLHRMETLRMQLINLESFNDHVPWHLDFFLYSGNQVQEPAEAAYFSQFRKYFLTAVSQVLIDQLGNLPAGQGAEKRVAYGTAYDNLRAYLMITSDGCPSQRPFLPNLLTEVWSSQSQVDRSLNAKEIFNQSDFYSQHLASQPDQLKLAPQAAAIDRGRAYVAQYGNEQRVYRQLIDEVNHKSQDNARLSDYAPNYAAAVKAYPDQMPAAFTRTGWTAVQDAIQRANASTLGDTCVFGAGAGSPNVLDDARLRERLTELYVRDYVGHWREFLSTLHVTPYKDAGDAAAKLSILDGNGSPMMLALYMVHENTQIAATAPAKVEAQVEAGAARLLRKFTNKLGRGAKTANSAIGNATIPAQAPQQTSISRIFEPVHALFQPDATRGRWAGNRNRKYLDSLGSMARAMGALSQTSSAAIDVGLNNDAARSYTDGLDQVRQMDLEFDRDSDHLSGIPDDIEKSVKSLLEEPFHRTDGQFSRDPDKIEAQKANGELKPFCASLEPLLNKFPFKKNGADSSLAEFSSVFSPQSGALSTLTQRTSTMIGRTNGSWQQLATVGNVRVSPDFLAQLNRLSTISDFFFDNKPDAHLDYRLSTLPDPSFQSTKLSIDDRPVANGDKVSWPGDAGGLQIKVVSGSANIPCSAYSGPWAVFHFIADARQIGSELTYPCYSQGVGGKSAPVEIGDKQLVLRLRFEAVNSGARLTFDPAMFQGLRCPSRIVDPK